MTRTNRKDAFDNASGDSADDRKEPEKKRVRWGTAIENTSDGEDSDAGSHNGRVRFPRRHDSVVELIGGAGLPGCAMSAVRAFIPHNSSVRRNIHRRGRIGCAYYDPVKCILYVME